MKFIHQIIINIINYFRQFDTSTQILKDNYTARNNGDPFMKTLQLGEITIGRQDKLESSDDISCVSLSINELPISNVISFIIFRQIEQYMNYKFLIIVIDDIFLILFIYVSIFCLLNIILKILKILIFLILFSKISF